MDLLDKNELVTIEVKMPKDFSSFFYFTLESNEGIAFYSTLDSHESPLERIVEVNCTKELYPQLQNILKQLSQMEKMEIKTINFP